MRVEEVKTEEGLGMFLALARRHPAKEYDCSFEQWESVVRRLVGGGRFRVWLGLEDKTPVGYVAGVRNTVLRNEVEVFDILLIKKGRQNLLRLVWEVKKWATEDKALRVVWTSRVRSGVWSRALHLPVSAYETLSWEVGGNGG